MKRFLSIILTVILLIMPMTEAIVSAVPSAVDSADVTTEVIPLDESYDDSADLTAEVTYSVNFNANGGTNAPLYQKKIEGRNLIIKTAMPTKDGYTFAGWATSASSTSADYLPGGVYTQDKDITLYAVWTDKFGGHESTAADYMVIATPHNSLGYEDFTYNYGYECLVLSRHGDISGDCPDTIILTPEQLGIPEGTSDNYFMNVFSLLMVLDEYKEVHSIIAAQNKAVKKTVTDLKLCEVTTSTASSYFSDSDGNAKLLSGEVIADGESFYVFDAPATYANETYPEGSDEYVKYIIRNSKNIRSLSFDISKEDGQNCYYAYVDDIVSEPDYYEVKEGYFETQALELLERFYNVYYDGLYEADLYDIDGDGLYDYIDYKPYTFFQVDADEDEYFEDSDFGGYNSYYRLPYIYTNEATVIGESFEDGDFVIGYFNASLETVKIAAVIKPTVDYVRSFKKTNGTITLGSGQVLDAVSSWRFIYNDYREIVWDIDEKTEEIVYDSDYFRPDILDGDKITFYVYNNIILFSENYDDSAKYEGNLIIPTDIRSPKSVFDGTSGESIWYVYAWVDGSTKYIPIKTVNVYPMIIDKYAGDLSYEYANKLCTYTIDEDGIYTITSLGYAHKDEDGIYNGISQDIEVLDDEKKNIQYYGEFPETTVTKIAGSRFDIGFERTVHLTDDTKIVLRSYSNDEYTFVEYDAASFKESLDFTIYNVSFVLENNPNSLAKENLLLLYGETDDLDNDDTIVEPIDKGEITLENIKNNLIIPTNNKYPRNSLDVSTGVYTWYIYAYVDGSEKYVPVDIDKTHPEIINKYSDDLTAEYADKLCTYAIDENGIYTIRSLGYDENTDGEYTGINTDVSAMSSNDANALLYLEANYSNIIGASEDSLTLNCLEFDLNLNESTKIVIKAKSEDDYYRFKFLEYNASSFISAIDGDFMFENLGIVISNNTENTSSENLVVLFAETYDIVFDDDEEIIEKGEITLEDIKNNLIIPTPLEGKKLPVDGFTIDSNEDFWYIYAWIDGETKYVPVAVDDTNPKIIDKTARYIIADEYIDKLCVYTVDDDGFYHIRSLEYDENYDNEFTGIPQEIEVLDGTDSGALYYGELYEGKVSKIAGTRYDIGFERDVDLNEDTKIIIRVEDEKYNGETSYEYILFDASSLTKSIENALFNVDFVLTNNPDSKSRENLLLLYAETDRLEFAGKAEKSGDRIVSNYDIGQDEDGDWRHYYELYNPYTGSKEYDVPSSYCAEKASGLYNVYEAGSIIQLVDGKVDEYRDIGYVDTSNLIWISEVFESDGAFAAVPYNDYIEYPEEIDSWMEEASNETIMDIYGNEIYSNYISYDENTDVSILTYSKLDSIWKWGNMSLSDMSTVADKKKNVLCYNEKATDRTGNYVTRYSNYVKAYVAVDDDVDEYELPIAKYIIVIVNGDEPSALYGQDMGQNDSVSVTGVTLNKTSLSLVEGERETLTASVLPSDATNKNVSWASSDESVATVQNGVVTAIKEGVATITVTTLNGAKTASCTVTVTKPEEPKATVRLSDTIGKAGETVSVIVSLNTDELINTVGITGITYDKNTLTFNSFIEYDQTKELIILESFDVENMTVVLGFEEPRTFNGDLFELKFIINEDAVDGTNKIDVSSLIKLDHTEITVNDVAGSVTVVSESVGDISHDEVVDATDAIMLLQHSLFPNIYPIEYKGSLDFTKDGYVDLADAVLLLQHSLFPEDYPISYN